MVRFKRSRALLSAAVALALVFAPVLSTTIASAGTVPAPGTPATVSADPLPTVQIDGIVWDQAIYGNKVYATGRFTQARPAGVAVGGAGSVTRTNLLAYDITTGLLDTSFVHSLSGGTTPEGRSIAVSPDGTKLYVGGRFTTVDGQPRSNIAAFNLTTNTLMSGFSGTNGMVKAVAATNTMAYFGGAFSTAGGQSRAKVAAYNSTGTINTTWRANVSGPAGNHVDALTAVISTGNLIIGGSFTSINSATYYSIGAVKLATGANVPWASQSSSYIMKMQPPSGYTSDGLGITSLTDDETQVYLTAFTYIPGSKPGSFEGRAAINASNGAIIWLNDCVGDSYDSFPVGQVLYSVNHSHSCATIGGFPQQNAWRALAETTYRTGSNVGSNGGNYPSYAGQPSSTLLDWFPTLTTANVSGSSQAAWNVVGNSQYIALGGEFPRVQGINQQGLVRYGVQAVAPNKIGPFAYGAYNNGGAAPGYSVMALPATSTGTSAVTIYTTGDPDNGTLTYEVYKPGATTPVATRTVDARYWNATNWTFTDTGVPVGKSLQYKLVVKDPFGNARTTTDATVINDTDPRIVKSGSGWVSSQNRGNTSPDFARGVHYTTVNGSSYSLTFTGTQFRLIGEKVSTRGNISISVDGGAPVTVSAVSPTIKYQQILYERSGLAAGTHTVKVTKTSGTYMDIDAIFVK